MKKVKAFLILPLLALVMLCSACQSEKTESGGEKYYTVFFGLNDAETNTQKVSTGDASKAIRRIITDKGLGYTEYTAYGAHIPKTENPLKTSLLFTFWCIWKKVMLKVLLTQRNRSLI